MTREEILRVIEEEEYWYDQCDNEGDRFERGMRISALYDQLAALDSAQLILEHPEDMCENDLSNFEPYSECECGVCGTLFTGEHECVDEYQQELNRISDYIPPTDEDN